MSLTRRILVAVGCLLVAAAVPAQNVVGSWKGKVAFDAGRIPKAKTPEQQAQIDAGLAVVKQMKIGLLLRANKTYVATVSAIPGQPGKKQENAGTWKQQGSTIWLTATTENGKPAKDKKPQSLSISKNGRMLTLVPRSPQGSPGQGIRINFTR